MKFSAVVALVAGIVIPLQAATFGYVLSVERRLARLEARDELRPLPHVAAQASPQKASAPQ